jgi:hypothetical protein
MGAGRVAKYLRRFCLIPTGPGVGERVCVLQQKWNRGGMSD